MCPIELRIYIATPPPCLDRSLLTMAYLSIEISESLILHCIVSSRRVSFNMSISKYWFIMFSLRSSRCFGKLVMLRDAILKPRVLGRLKSFCLRKLVSQFPEVSQGELDILVVSNQLLMI